MFTAEKGSSRRLYEHEGEGKKRGGGSTLPLLNGGGGRTVPSFTMYTSIILLCIESSEERKPCKGSID